MTPTAILCVLGSAFLHAGWNVMGKRSIGARAAGRDAAPGFFRPLVAGALLLSPLAVPYAEHLLLIPASVWLLVVLAGFFQALYFGGLAAAYRHGDLSVAYPTVRALPVLLVTGVTVARGNAQQLGPAALLGILLVAAASFLLPVDNLRSVTLRTYLNRMTAFAVLAAIGTAGYSVVDDLALRVLRRPQHLGDRLATGEIALLYLMLQAWSAVIWLAFLPGRAQRRRKPTRIQPITFLAPIFIGLLIHATYGLVLLAMAHASDVSYVVAFRQAGLPIGVAFGAVLLRERVGVIRLCATLALTAGLILMSIA